MNSWITQNLFDENINEFAKYIRNNSNNIEHVQILKDKFNHVSYYEIYEYET